MKGQMLEAIKRYCQLWMFIWFTGNANAWVWLFEINLQC